MNVGREKAVRFGTGVSLVGILTEPAPGTPTDGKPAFLLLNSGILHRVGSCRLHVRLARALSAAGFTSLRFDYSGVGDSEPRRDALPFEQSAVAETRDAMDYLARAKGATGFVLMGLCSGADMAHETALVDDRVAALALLDGWVYRTPAHYVRHYLPKLLRWRVWQNSIRIRWQILADRRHAASGRPESDGVEYEVAKYVRVFPPRERLERDFQRFVERRVAMYCLWTGGLPEYNHKGQFAAAFRRVPFGALLSEDHLPGADHILTNLQHQDYVLSHIVQWAQALDVRTGTPAGARSERATSAPALRSQSA